MGLEAKDKAHIPIVVDAAKLNDEFRVSDKPAPIFVEYRVTKEIFSPKLSWQRGGFSPGRYRLTNIAFRIASTKENGKPWDALSDPPDPFITVMLDGEKVDTCLVKDQKEGSCSSQKVVTLTEKSSLKIVVVDKDLSRDDDVGTASLDNVMAAGKPYSEIELATQGQLERATVTFVPVAGGASPAVATPADP